MSFAYLKDPLFLACFGAYWINRALESCDLGTPFFSCYLNDIVCVPFWVPIMLWVNRKLRLRHDDGPPASVEILIPLLIWCAAFEVVIPIWFGSVVTTVADPADVLCYCAGALAATVFWRWYYRAAPAEAAART